MSKELTTKVASHIQGMLKKNSAALIKTLPRGFNYDRMCRTVINAISTTPKLAECTPASIFLSCVKAFSMGLEPNGPFGHGYLIPFNSKITVNGKKTWVKECQFMPGYRGLIDCARRSGEIALVKASVVHENDTVNVNAATAQELHSYNPFAEDRGKVLGYLAIFVLKDGTFDFEAMRISEINDIRERSKSKDFGPWVTDYNEMAKKTVLKRLLKRAPMSIEKPELAEAVEADHKASTGERQNNEDIIDVVGLEVSEEDRNMDQKIASEMADDNANAVINKAKKVDKANAKKETPAKPKKDSKNIAQKKEMMMSVIDDNCKDMIELSGITDAYALQLWNDAGQDVQTFAEALMALD